MPFIAGERYERKTHCKHGHEMTPENTRTQNIVGYKGNTYTVHSCKTCRGKAALASARRKAERERAISPERLAEVLADSAMWV